MKDTNRIITQEKVTGDDEVKIRPQALDDFIGQPYACANLKVFIEAAKKRQEPLDHVLLYGPPGLGKTTLAQIIAKEMNVGLRMSAGPILVKGGDLAAILTNLQPHDVLFIDEIHRLNPAVEEILYPAMEDYKLDLIIGEGPAARSVTIDLPPFTLIGATTRSGLLTNPLRDRFGIPVHLEFYTHDDLKEIVCRAAKVLKMKISDDAAYEVARRSRGTPRISGRLLKRVRDFWLLSGETEASKEFASKALSRLKVDTEGLDFMDQQYLHKLAFDYQGGPVGVETLAAALSESKDVIEDVIEPYLIQKGYIQKTPRGRLLAPKGYRKLDLHQDLETTPLFTKK